jgi:hypothetical protein
MLIRPFLRERANVVALIPSIQNIRNAASSAITVDLFVSCKLLSFHSAGEVESYGRSFAHTFECILLSYF